MIEAHKMALASQILSRPAKTWAERKAQIDAVLAIDDPKASDEAVVLLEREAKILFGSSRE